MPKNSAEIDFRPVTMADLPMLRAWMETPHWRQWWGEPGEEIGFIREMVKGRDTTRPFIFTVGDDPVGYIQYWFVGEHQTDEWTGDYPWLLEFPADAIGVDISIGQADRLSRGIGSKVLRQFLGDLVEKGYETIIIDPDPHNVRAIRAYTKAGFRPVVRLEGRYDGELIMQYDNKSNELN
ncbi:MAG: GNAT family N-acetyltransferase [Rhizobiaceae bacterium]